MHVTVHAQKLEPVVANDQWVELAATALGDEPAVAGGISLLGDRSERLSLIADWAIKELEGADMRDAAIITEFKRLMEALDAKLILTRDEGFPDGSD